MIRLDERAGPGEPCADTGEHRGAPATLQLGGRASDHRQQDAPGAALPVFVSEAEEAVLAEAEIGPERDKALKTIRRYAVEVRD